MSADARIIFVVVRGDGVIHQSSCHDGCTLTTQAPGEARLFSIQYRLSYGLTRLPVLFKKEPRITLVL